MRRRSGGSRLRCAAVEVVASADMRVGRVCFDPARGCGGRKRGVSRSQPAASNKVI